MSMIVKSVPEKSLLIGRHAADEIGTIESATGTIGRIVHCGPYGTWFVGDWRPRCATCHGAGRVAASETELIECLDCRLHPGRVVG